MSLNQLINPSGGVLCDWANYECYNLNVYQGITSTNIYTPNFTTQTINGVTGNIDNIKSNIINSNIIYSPEYIGGNNIAAANGITSPYFLGITATFNTSVTTPNLYGQSIYYTGATGQQLTANLVILKSGNSNFRTVISNDDIMTYNANNYFKETGSTINNIVLACGTTCGQSGVNIGGDVTCNSTCFTIFTQNAPIVKKGSGSFRVFNNKVNPSSKISVSINDYTGDVIYPLGNGGLPSAYVVNIQDGSFYIRVINIDDNVDMSGTLKLFVQVFN